MLIVMITPRLDMSLLYNYSSNGILVTMNTLSDQIAALVQQQYNQPVEVRLTRPDPQFGDYATNVALQLAKPLGKNPRELAEEIAELLRGSGDFSEVSVAGPGFINLRVAAAGLARSLEEQWSDTYGENTDGAGKTAVSYTHLTLPTICSV